MQILCFQIKKKKLFKKEMDEGREEKEIMKRREDRNQERQEHGKKQRGRNIIEAIDAGD